MKDFIVTFVYVDGGSFDGVTSKVMTGSDAVTVARSRVAEEASYHKAEHQKCTDGLTWEETLPGRYLEDEKEIVKIISGWHSYYMIFIFTLDGKQINIEGGKQDENDSSGR